MHTRLLIKLVAMWLVACEQRPQTDAVHTPEQAEPNPACAAPAELGDGAVDRALSAAQHKLARKPNATETLTEVGRAWVHKARHDRMPKLYANALACAQAVLRENPAHADALTLQGLALMEEHRFDEVLALAKKLVELDPDNPVGFALLSDASLELGQLDAAVEAAQRMMDLKPDLPAYARAAHLRAVQGDRAGAKRLYRHAIQIGQLGADREALAWVTTEAAKLFLEERDYDGARAGFEQALSVLDRYAPALAGRAEVGRRLSARAANDRKESSRVAKTSL